MLAACVSAFALLLSLVVVLASFMGGMALGSAVAPRVLSGRRHPLLVFAGLEVGIAV